MNQEHMQKNSSVAIVPDTQMDTAVYRVKKRDGILVPFSHALIEQAIVWAQSGYEDEVDTQLLVQETVRNCFDKISESEIADALIMAAVTFIERDPVYGHVAARLLFKKLFRQVTTKSVLGSDVDHEYSVHFVAGIQPGNVT